MTKSDDIKKAMRKRKRKPVLSSQDFLSTGSTLLNLACSGRPDGGFAKGVFSFLVGDSSSGKTFLSLTCLAEAALNLNFADHQFLFYNAENGALMDVEKFFGAAVAKRMQERKPESLEQFYYQIDDDLNNGPAIAILDSMDALVPEEDREQFDKEKRASGSGKEISGSYGTSKAKKNSANLRVINNRIAETGSVLIIISQTRDNIGFDARFNPKTRSGGKALRFYSRLELWSSIKGHIKRPVNGTDRNVGIISQVKVVKNHICGWEGKVEIPIYRSLGIDDLGSCVNYLVSEGHWKEARKQVEATDFGVTLKAEELVAYVEENALEEDLRVIVADVWQDIESKCEVKRKQRYV